MSGEKFSAVLLQPHDTPLSQLLSQHRQILGKLAQSSSLLFPEHQVYPLHPSHCLVQSPLEIRQLKKNIRGCTILPPVLSHGVLLRPILLEGGNLEEAAVALQSILPLFRRELDCQKRIFNGFVFGCLRNRYNGRIIDKIDESNELNGIIADFNISPLKLRVLRLHPVEYSWSPCPNQGGNPESVKSAGLLPSTFTPGALTWVLAPPQWVKIRP